MAQTLNRLNSPAIKGAAKKGLYADGGNLYLSVAASGAKSWVFVFQWAGKRKEMGLGGLLNVDLKTAREKAETARKLLGKGVSPLDDRRDTSAARLPAEQRTFVVVAERYIAWKEGTWKHPKYARDWRRMLTTHAAPLRDLDVGLITAADLSKVFRPIWATMTSAKEMRARVRQVLDAAISWGLRTAPNPDPMLDALLPKRQVTKVHRVAMPYEDVPRLMRQLREKDTVSSLALQFTVLTAVRSQEALGARQAEFDLEAALWVIPKERMKAGVEHRVPLSPQAQRLVESLWDLTEDYVFPGGHFGGARPGSRPMAHPTLWNLLGRVADKGLTVHGFRSSFSDWAAETTEHAAVLVEAALAHAVGSQVARAYRRTDLLDKRRQLMNDWADYATGRIGPDPSSQ